MRYSEANQMVIASQMQAQWYSPYVVIVIFSGISKVISLIITIVLDTTTILS